MHIKREDEIFHTKHNKRLKKFQITHFPQSVFHFCFNKTLEMTEPVRNLEGKATSNQSFTLNWQNPEYTNGPVKRYEVFWKTDRFAHWRNVPIGRKEGSNMQSYSFSWRGTALQIGYAPVVYWKIEIYGFVNQGPTSAVHAFRVCLGGKFLTQDTL